MATTGTCPQCGVTLSTGALGGLCPACLLKQGADTKGEEIEFEAPQVEEVRRLFPQFEVIELLAKGGMGVIYKVRQPALDRVVALKLFPLKGPHGPAFVERFNREARALAKLSHPNIVAVHDFGQVDGFAFFIMEFVDGLNLRELERIGRLSPREALKIVPQICEALQFAHDEGIVHRDIKPENILLDKRGRVKIADFGIAKIMGRELRLPETQHVIGTPHYMAPEQVEKPETVDHRADIYSLGVVFYEMLTGELPLGKFAPPSRKVEVDVRLDEVVLRALEKEPDRRYQQANHVKTAVETIGTRMDKPATVSFPRAFGTELLKVILYGLAVLAGSFVLMMVMYFLKREDGKKAQQTVAQGYGVDSLPPVVVSTEPVSGSRDVPPGPFAVRVAFSKGMMPGNWSWSSAWSNSTPQILAGARYAADGRTCMLTVNLEPGRTYAYWLNSDQFKNFRDTEGRPAVPYLLIFETKQTKQKTSPPSPIPFTP